MSESKHLLDKIVIVFENLETIEIPIQYVKNLRIDNVKTMETYDYDSSIIRQDPIQKLKKADYVELIIDYNYLNDNDKDEDKTSLSSAERLITGRDITAVELYFKNTNKCDSISVPWMSTHGGIGTTNAYQDCVILKDYNRLEQNPRLKKIWSKEEIENYQKIIKKDPFMDHELIKVMIGKY